LPLLTPLQEATEALKPILGDYYSKDGRNVLQALWQELVTCQYVVPERDGSGVLWFATHTKTDVVSATAVAAAGFNAAKAAKAA
jgi:omega-6 fatty acid desaturase (delta-12 desaturase)